MQFIRCDRCDTLIEVMAERDRHPTQCWRTLLAARYPGHAHPANYLRTNLCSECYAQFMAFVGQKKLEQPKPASTIEISVQSHRSDDPIWPRDYCHYTVRQGDRYCDELCYDEMLGTVIALLPRPPSVLASRVRTQHQHDVEDQHRQEMRAARAAEKAEGCNGDC